MGHEPATDVSAFEGDDLTATLHAAWQPFVAAVAVRRGPFHTPSIATIGAGAVPRLRTVVLRDCDADGWRLRFHTDRRSAKFEELSANPAIALHVYSQPAKLQVRLDGVAHLHCDDEFASLAWDRSQPSSRACYAQAAAPGVRLEAPEPDLTVPAGPRVPVQTGRQNFCAVQVQIVSLEWLYLRAAGHRRARFERNAAAGGISATWLAP
jgi:pyridoxine/pyridoxamine 5'-phosphate oxidase